MQRVFSSVCLLTASLALLTACDKPEPDRVEAANTEINDSATEAAKQTSLQTSRPAEDTVIEINWDALIPDDWHPDKLLQGVEIDNLSDDDPKAKELLEKMKAFWKEAPVVDSYQGKTVKLPGFVVPLEMDAEKIDEFLLVPYYGACIHTPPPPANQTIYVVMNENQAFQGKLFDTVWVTGKMTIEKLSSELGDSGYRINALSVEPYEEK